MLRANRKELRFLENSQVKAGARTFLLVGPCTVVRAAASLGLRQGDCGGTCGPQSPACHLCVSLWGEGLPDIVIRPGSCVGGTKERLSELAEHEGLSAGRPLVTSGCLRGGTPRFVFLAVAGVVRALAENNWKREYPWLGAARRRLGSEGRLPAGWRARTGSERRGGRAGDRAAAGPRHARRRHASSGGGARWRGEEATARAPVGGRLGAQFLARGLGTGPVLWA